MGQVERRLCPSPGGTPKAMPSRSGAVLSEMRASRGAVRRPLPMRSASRNGIAGTQATSALRTSPSRVTAEIEYPVAAVFLWLWRLSAIEPPQMRKHSVRALIGRFVGRETKDAKTKRGGQEQWGRSPPPFPTRYR